MSIPLTSLISAIFSFLLGVCVFLFRSETRRTEISPSRATKWRFYLARVGSFLFLVPLISLVFRPALTVFGAAFLAWPLFALWLSAAPMAYRSRSAYLLSCVSVLSIAFWYVFWRSSGVSSFGKRDIRGRCREKLRT